MARKKRRTEQETAQPAATRRPAVLPLVLCGLLVVLTLAVFWQVTGHEFINLDDDRYVSANEHVQRGFSLDEIIWAFTEPTGANWHPLTMLSHIKDYTLWGANPMGHHLTSLLLHLANVLLLFLFFYLATGYAGRSAFVAALFAVHPLHVESVAWVAERKDVLSTFFWLLTMLAYLRYARKPGIGRYLLVAAGLALGLMSKPMVVSLPIVLLIMDYWPLGRTRGERALSSGKLLLEKVPLFALALASSIVTFLVQKSWGAVQQSPLTLRASNAIVSYAEYLVKTIWPTKLAVLYPFPKHVPALSVVAAVFLLAAITVLVVRLRGKYPYLAAGWLWYVITLIPVIGIVQVGFASMADRYTYVPLIGVFAMVAWLVPDALAGRGVRTYPLLPALAVVVVVALAGAAWVQAGYWKDSYSLWNRAVRVTADNGIAHMNMGGLEIDRGDVDAAMAHTRETIRLIPEYTEGHYILGSLLAREGRWDEALPELRKAVKLRPDISEAQYFLGSGLVLRGDTDEGIRHLKAAAGSASDNPLPHYALLEAYMKKGDYASAWAEVHSIRRMGGEPSPDLVRALSKEMPEPGR